MNENNQNTNEKIYYEELKTGSDRNCDQLYKRKKGFEPSTLALARLYSTD